MAVAGCAAVTDPAENVEGLTATLRGHGHSDSTPAHFEFQYATAPHALGTGFGLQTPTRGPISPNTPGNGGDDSFSQDIGGLTLGTKYYYRVCGGDGKVNPDVCSTTQSFTTANSPTFKTFGSAIAYGIVSGPDGALWGLGVGSVDRQTTSDQSTSFQLPSGDQASDLTGAFDGALWFPDNRHDAIGRITTSGHVTEYPLPTANAAPVAIASGPDTALWFVEAGANQIGRITLSGKVTEYPLPSPSSEPSDITPGSDGALWFTEPGIGRIGRITTSGTVSEYPVSSATDPPRNIAAGSDHALWFLLKNQIGRLATDGTVSLYPTETGDVVGPGTLIGGPDGALWYTGPASCSTPTYSCPSELERTTISGQTERFPLPHSCGSPALGVGPDRAIWLGATNHSFPPPLYGPTCAQGLTRAG